MKENTKETMKKPKIKKTEIIESNDLYSEEDLNQQINEVEEKKNQKIADPVIEKPAQQYSQLEILQNKKTINTVKATEDEPKVEEETKMRKVKKEEPKKEYPRYYNTPILEGLSDEIIEQRKADMLVNIGSQEKGKTIIGIIFHNLFTFFNMLYLVITILFIILGSTENLLFLLTIIPNLIIGIIQEIKAKKTIDKLSLMSSPITTVIRNSHKIDIPIQEVVLDDIVFYTPGKQICADSVVVEGFIEVNESLLTGESDVVIKNVGDNLFSGSFVVSGVAVARVDKVGKDNYIEKLSKDAKVYKKPHSELLRTLNGIIKVVSVIIIPLAILTYVSSTNEDILDFLGILNKDALIKASSSVLAMIPAGLFLLTSMALAYSVVKLGNSKTLVQELYCIEMLARVNVLCLDKTGTITDGTMRVCDCVEIKNHTEYTIREIIGSMMNAFEDVNPTSDALIKYFDKNSILSATEKIPFSSKRKFSAVTFGKTGTFVLGAPEFVLFENYDKVAAKVERYTQDGCRVLVLGHTLLKVKADELPKSIKPISLVVLQDHIREDAADTIEYFKQNGVDVKVISGDNPVTVSQIALRAGVEGAERYISLAGLTDDEVRESVFEYTVFGRVSPNQKRILVKTLREHKKTVAMTGDGVNDILALKEADCSIAMASGSEATRYVSHLVLMDSNFSCMPKVVQEGRRVINNIQRTSTLFLVKTMFSIMLAVLYIFLGMQPEPYRMSYPFSAKNLYMVEWFAIGIPALFLALQPNRDIVKGKFLSNVLKSTLPGALTVVALHLLLNLIRIIPGFESFRDNYEVFTTVATIITTTVMILILFRVSKPFNLWRKVVFAFMVILCFLGGFNLIPFMKIDLSFRKNVEDYEIKLEVNELEYWELNDQLTTVKAIKKPGVSNVDNGTYLMPDITISEHYFWSLNGIPTTVSVYDRNDDNILVLKVVNGFWQLEGVLTKARAYHNPEVVTFADKEIYEVPVLTINSKGYWCLDGYSTEILAAEVNKELKFTVHSSGYWYLNGRRTPIRAEEKKLIINEEEYVTPTVTIVTESGKRFFYINDSKTEVLANNGDRIELTVGEDLYWYLNGVKTDVKAEKIVDTIVDDVDYMVPTVTINSLGKFNLNDIGTDVEAPNNLLITEILITLLLVQMVNPLIYLVSKLLKRFRIAPNN